MTGTDPEGGKQGSGKQRSFDSTQPYRPPEAADAPPLPPDLPKIPGITLHYEIARGGMGVVYSGRQDFLDRRVAVKLLSVELGGEAFVQRFQREAKILAGVKHPNIVGCHLAGTADGGQSYLVMEFIDGPSLKKWVSDHGPLPVPAALRLTRAVAQALSHAYQLGIIHRDVKPENILLETVTSTALDIAFPFTPKLVDLGLARTSSGSASLGLTSPGSVMGTPATMSPEQYDDPDAVDFRSDIYGLGCALFEMLVGVPAYRAKKLTEIVAQKRAPCAPDPCKDNPVVPAAVGTLVQEMLATQREDRPASYKELDERLAALLDAIASSSRAAKTKPPPVADEGATIVSKPGAAAKANPFFDEEPAGAPKQPTQPPATGKTSGPGLLRTAEINFLAEGLGDVQPPAADPAAFKSGIRSGGTAPPQPTAPGSPFASGSQLQPTAPLTIAPTPPPNPNKKKLMMIGGAIALVAAIGIGIAMSSGGKEKENGGNGGGTGNTSPSATNHAPKIVAITGPERVNLKDSFPLAVDAKDEDGDTLSYAWTWPEDLVRLRSRANRPELRLDLVDGLPDLPFEVSVVVDDLKGHTVQAVKKILVGECPHSHPLIGFESTGAWRIDKADRRWVEVSDPSDRHVSCRAVDTQRTMTTSLGSEPYWEWSGTLASDEEPKSVFAELGLRFEFGTQGWAVVCRRQEAGGDLWQAEIMEAVPSRDSWSLRSLPAVAIYQFRQPRAPKGEDPEEEMRAWFVVQRRGRQLALQMGEERSIVERPDAKPAITKGKEILIDLPETEGEPKLTLFVNRGIGRFRITQQ